MEATEITEQLKSVILDTYGDRVGTFKLQSVDEETSKARQKARGQLSKEQRLIIDRALVPFRDWLIDRDPEAAERVANGSPAPQDIETEFEQQKIMRSRKWLPIFLPTKQTCLSSDSRTAG